MRTFSISIFQKRRAAYAWFGERGIGPVKAMCDDFNVMTSFNSLHEPILRFFENLDDV